MYSPSTLPSVVAHPDTVIPPLRLSYEGLALSELGEPKGTVITGPGLFQPFTEGILLQHPAALNPLFLHASGEVHTKEATALSGQAIAPSRHVTMHWQAYQGGAILWSEPTGLLILLEGYWRLPLDGGSV
jgi:hypothetical protein